MAIPQLVRTREAVRTGRYRLTAHAERERESDAITVGEIEQVFGSESLELLEDYPDDPRGTTALLLGFTTAGQPLHGVVSNLTNGPVFFVTLYPSDQGLWYDLRRRA